MGQFRIALRWKLSRQGSRKSRAEFFRDLGYSELKNQEVREILETLAYLYEVKLPEKFVLLGHHIELQPFKKVLRIDEWEVPIEKIELTGKGGGHGLGLTVETPLKGIYRGHKLILRFHRDGASYIVFDGNGHEIKSLDIRDGLIEIVYRPDYIFIAPLRPEPLQIDIRYDMNIDVRGMQAIRLTQRLRTKFGYDNIESLRSNIEAGRYMVSVRYDNRMTENCQNTELHVKVPEGATEIVEIEIKLGLRGMVEELNNRFEAAKSEEQRQEVVDSSRTLIGDIGEKLAEAKKEGELFERISESTGIPKHELLLKGPNEKGPDFIFYLGGTDKKPGIVEVKSTLNMDYLNDRMKEATDDLIKNYFTSDTFKHAEYGIPVAVYFNVEELLSSDFSSGFEIKVAEPIRNPNFEP